MPVRSPPANTRGASVSFCRPLMIAPICRSGSTILPIGLELSELSPVRTANMSRPPRTPDISRIVVPLLPASRMTAGSVRPSAAPLMRRESPESSAEGVRSTLDTEGSHDVDRGRAIFSGREVGHDGVAFCKAVEYD